MICDVGLDIRMLRHTGIGTYLRGLLGEFSKPSCAGRLALTLYGPEELCRLYPQWEGRRFRAPIYSLGEQWAYPDLLRPCALWHAPHYNVPFFKPKKTKLVTTVHDLIHWIFRRELYTPVHAAYTERMIRRALAQSDRLITVSQKTRDDLVEHFRADPARMEVIHEGVGSEFRRIEDRRKVAEALSRWELEGEYFLYVGSIKPHKNVQLLLRLFEKMRRRQGFCARLVIVGSKARHYPPAYRGLKDLCDSSSVRWIPEASVDDLVCLYNGALALLHPSKYEGFGLTLLEAMACHTPVLAARAASLPEVAGEGALLLDPDDEASWEDAVARLAREEAFRAVWRERGLRRVQNFCWENTARQTLAVYERVLNP